ncbi:hypothetical protein CDAR_557741 [Caerostris darwini]|uniref:Uncharacterized protein n=1 Tax=Caerostris darwini TaxID=1538125 RepID=A0AAV4TSM1_9ARAC|nr:hypothetical protein CDAR_557741 [Caerostris darwini]
MEATLLQMNANGTSRSRKEEVEKRKAPPIQQILIDQVQISNCVRLEAVVAGINECSFLELSLEIGIVSYLRLGLANELLVSSGKHPGNLYQSRVIEMEATLLQMNANGTSRSRKEEIEKRKAPPIQQILIYQVQISNCVRLEAVVAGINECSFLELSLEIGIVSYLRLGLANE